eukprot:CAMPEP_0206510154 /NCGR_PEP_ID=MMETSP0324_2-20121206/59439_1 /ASSEMBLY_ACC=CAM_ASM_000836 /TAXON_ID=2866 /ORGANISM="Crypthecodinium cohnii, Strain Seligo" /LENGTH=71 /DNA_ID=CAMNT_0054001515 /DNA_START=23 /DNA_END=235 /DNA_ORIENTATION=+
MFPRRFASENPRLFMIPALAHLEWARSGRHGCWNTCFCVSIPKEHYREAAAILTQLSPLIAQESRRRDFLA